MAASSSATLSSIATLNGSISIGLFHVPFDDRRRREHDGTHERRAIGLRLRDGLLRDARDFVLRQVAARGEAPRAVDERANAEAVRLVVGDAGDALFARRDVLTAIANEANVGVVGPGALRGIEGDHRELFDVGFGSDERRIRRRRSDESVGREATGG